MNDDDDSKLKANRINWVLCVYVVSENFTHQHSLMPLSKFKEATLANHHAIVFMYRGMFVKTHAACFTSSDEN